MPAASLRRLAAALLLLAASPAVADTPRDPQIEALIGRMSVEEKAGQLSLYVAPGASIEPDINPVVNLTTPEAQLADIRAGKVTGLFNGFGAEWARRAQQAAVEGSRLRIPLIFGADVIHGFRTVFPVPLAEAASWEPELARRTARAAATEAAAAGINWTFAPMVDIARDPRWGRGVEGAGEDVFLGRQFAAARVRGFQGGAGVSGAPLGTDAVVATPKHFAAYGAAEGGIDYNTVDISERTLREVYLPPFKAGFDAGALTTMSAFNEVAGIPATADGGLLTGVLRGEWDFPGFVVSDYASDQELVAHGIAADERDAARQAFLAGVDMSMQSGLYMRYLPGLVADGSVPMARLDEAVRRVLWVKKRLGLFDDPYRYIDPAREAARIGTPEHRALAREAARKSMVLLKNDNGVLPLDKGKHIAVIGPFALGQEDTNGPWTVFARNVESVSLEQGLKAALPDAALPKGGRLTLVKGSEVEAPLAGGIEAAVAAAKAADVVVLALGEGQGMSGEAQSRSAVSLPQPQAMLAQAVRAAVPDKPLVVLLRTGRALALRGAVQDADAILVTWFLGSESGNAIADILFGAAAPSGRLPVSFPQEPGQVPHYYAHKNTGRPAVPGQDQRYKARYRSADMTSLYPFGHGLTYSRIEYRDIRLSSPRLGWDDSLTASVRIANTGRREAEEVVQLYIRDPVASVTRPVRELKGFQKVRVAPGKETVVTFRLTRADLEFIGRDLKPTVEPGRFQLWLAPDAAAGTPVEFELVR